VTSDHGHGGSAGACCGGAPEVEAPPAAEPPAGAGDGFRIRGMDCAEEVRALKQAVGPVVGGEEHLYFDLLRGRMRVDPAAGVVTADAVIAAVASVGLTAEPWSAEGEEPAGGFWGRNARLLSTGGSGVLVAAGILVHAVLHGGLLDALTRGHGGGHALPVAAGALYLAAVVAGGWLVFPRAWSSARRLAPDMNLLMTVAVLGAFAIGEWLEGATVAFLFSVSLTLESWSVGRARRAVEALLDVAPQTARLLRPDGTTLDVSPDQVAIGDRVVVKPGERIPVDGAVRSGQSAVDQAPVTGESVPAPKGPGDPVFAGTINGDGALEVECAKTGGDTTIARIIRMVEEARGRRAPSEQWVERFARVYTPAVMALALIVAVAPPLLLGGSFADWLYRALVLLVIACPCALVISTPVSIVSALASAARQGVLVKGGAYLEAPARLCAIAFDKTGTLTRGRPEVRETVPLDDHSEADLLARAAALEARSGHPIAQAIIARADSVGATYEPAVDLTTLQGRGVTGRVDGKGFWLGSHRYLEERGQETPAVHERLEAMSAAGRSVVVVGGEDHVCGLIALADAVRPEAQAALAALRGAGISHLTMLTGDNAETAEAVGAAVGIDSVRAELLPEDKVAAVEALVEKYGAVAMVGDGINDAPAMARATLAIAMGAAGTDAAIETADIALMSDDLSRLPWLVRHSRRTLGIIRQNIAFALAVKAVFVVATFAGLASMWAAIAADMGASLLVIFNGLRLLHPGEGAAAANATTRETAGGGSARVPS